MAGSGQIQTNTAFGHVKLAWAIQSQDIGRNTSTITYTLSIYRSSAISSSAAKSYFIKINGVTVASGTNTIGGTGTKVLKTGTATISHSSDGTKTFSYSFSQQIDITWGSTRIGTVTGSGSGTLNTIPRATKPTLSATSANMGSAITISMNRASSSFTHTLTYKFGTASGVIGTSLGTSKSWTIPLALANQIPNASSGIGSITCKTYNGSTLIGTKSISFTAKVPSSVVPTISNITAAEAVANIATQFGAYVQNKSKAKVTINAAGAYSSTIKSYKTTFNGTTYTSASFTSGYLASGGALTISTTVTDSRGRTAKKTSTITVVEYHAPKLISFTGFRALQDGTANYDGTFLKLALNFAIAPVGNKNTKSYSVEYKETAGTTWTSLAAGSVYALNDFILSGSVLSPDKSYKVKLTVSDFFGAVNTTIDIPTAFTLVDFNASGKGIAFGKVSESDALEIALPIKSTLGHVISSPVQLAANQDLDAILDPGYYCIGSTTTSKTILNKPTTSPGTAFVEVLCGGEGLQKIQRYTLTDKDDQFVWQRVYYTNVWGTWQMLCGGTKTYPFTLEPDITSTRYCLARQGDMVTFYAALKINKASAAATGLLIGNIPVEVSPKNSVATIGVQGAVGTAVCRVRNTGMVYVRPREAITSGMIVEFNLSWNISANW